jgi:hypothetical protein
MLITCRELVAPPAGRLAGRNLERRFDGAEFPTEKSRKLARDGGEA